MEPDEKQDKTLETVLGVIVVLCLLGLFLWKAGNML